MRVLPLIYVARSSLGFALRRAISRATSEGRLAGPSREVDKELGSVLISLDTKHSSLSTIVGRMVKNWEAVSKKALVRDPNLDAYALDGAREESHELVADSEALFSTLQSMQYVGLRLVRVVERRFLKLKKQTTEEQLYNLPGLSSQQRQMLDGARNHFTHAAAPWFEVVIPDTGKPDLAILLTNDPNYASGTGYVLLSEVAKSVPGVVSYMEALEVYLVTQVDAHRTTSS